MFVIFFVLCVFALCFEFCLCGETGVASGVGVCGSCTFSHLAKAVRKGGHSIAVALKALFLIYFCTFVFCTFVLVFICICKFPHLANSKS